MSCSHIVREKGSKLLSRACEVEVVTNDHFLGLLYNVGHYRTSNKPRFMVFQHDQLSIFTCNMKQNLTTHALHLLMAMVSMMQLIT